MKKVLWISRHNMTQNQLKDLARIYGKIEIKQIDKTIENAAEIKDSIDECDIIAVVLPLEKIKDVKEYAKNKPVIQAVSKRVKHGEKLLENGEVETEYIFEHICWQELEQINIVVKVL